MKIEQLWYRMFPELALFETREERRKAWARANKPLGTGLMIWFSFLATFVWLVMWHAVRLLLPSLEARAYVAVLIATGMYFGGIIALVMILREKIRRSLREELVEQGRAICVECGYDLRGQTAARCPECGTAFDEKLLKDAEAPPSMQDRADS